jgi:hypothetical protein
MKRTLSVKDSHRRIQSTNLSSSIEIVNQLYVDMARRIVTIFSYYTQCNILRKLLSLLHIVLCFHAFLLSGRAVCPTGYFYTMTIPYPAAGCQVPAGKIFRFFSAGRTAGRTAGNIPILYMRSHPARADGMAAKVTFHVPDNQLIIRSGQSRLLMNN